jgi:hypothetical protein
VDVQHALLELRAQFGRVDLGRQGETADELAIRAFDLVELLPFLFLLLFTFALDRQHSVLELNLDVLSLHIRKIGFDQILVFRLLDIDGRRPVRKREGVGVAAPLGPFPEITIQSRLDAFELTKRIPSHNVHRSLP